MLKPVSVYGLSLVLMPLLSFAVGTVVSSTKYAYLYIPLNVSVTPFTVICMELVDIASVPKFVPSFK